MSGHSKIYRKPQTGDLMCPELGCGAVLDVAHATAHAWAVHRRMIFVEQRESYFLAPPVRR